MRISDWSSDVCSSDLPCRARDLIRWPRNVSHADEFPRATSKYLRSRLDEVFCCPDYWCVVARCIAGGGAKRSWPHGDGRSDERRVGKECVSTCRSRG